MGKVFSYEERVEAKEEMTSERIPKIFGTGLSVIERWIRIYKVHGYAGLNIKPYNMVYDQAFKDEAIKAALTINEYLEMENEILKKECTPFTLRVKNARDIELLTMIYKKRAFR